LQTLPGIGPVLASNIIVYREDHGGFISIDEIKKVSRIGEATFIRLKELITVE
jgi:competence protein ComEA